MGAGDRGGVMALSTMITNSMVCQGLLICGGLLSGVRQIPIICIANDGKSAALKPLKGKAYFIAFERFDDVRLLYEAHC